MAGIASNDRGNEGNVRDTLRGAAFLLRVPPSTIRRWASGYTDKLTYSTVDRPGALGPDVDADGLFTFPALIELLYVRELLKPWGTRTTKTGKEIPEERRLEDICKMTEYLRSKLGSYPMARARLREVGRELVTDQLHEDNHFTKADDGQHLLEIADEIVTSLDFDSEGLVNLWYPDKGNNLVYINPHVRFGCPIVPSGVSTEAIFDRYRVEGTVADTAEWFSIPDGEVEAGIAFEGEWRSKAKTA